MLKLQYNNRTILNSARTGYVGYEELIDPYNPLKLPAQTIRVRFSSGYTPSMGSNRTLIDSVNNIWDITASSWYRLFVSNTSLLEILGANTEGVSDITYMCDGASNLTTVALFSVSPFTSMRATFGGTSLSNIPEFNTGNITDFQWTFNGIKGHATIPLLDVHSCTNCNYMFWSATNIEGGALALYNTLAALGTQVSNHSQTFYKCGSNTVTGAAELAQIPGGWK